MESKTKCWKEKSLLISKLPVEHGLELLPSGHCSIKCHPQTTELSNHQTQLAARAFTHF